MPLDGVHVPQSCGADWEAMDGDIRRLCAGCGCHVHDLSALTRRQAQALLDDPQSGAAEGRLCVRFQTGPDGAILTQDDAPTIGADRTLSWPRRLAAAASWALALVVTGLGLTASAEAATPKAHHFKPKAQAKAKPHTAPHVPPHRFMGKLVRRHPQQPLGEGKTGVGTAPAIEVPPGVKQ